MVLVPTFKPITTPKLLILATLAEDVCHGFIKAGVPEPTKVVVAPFTMLNAPVIVGGELTVIGILDDTVVSPAQEAFDVNSTLITSPFTKSVRVRVVLAAPDI